MKVQVVSFHCVLKDKLGRTLGTSFNQDVLTWEPATNAQLKGLSQGLQDVKTGEKRRIFVPVSLAYGYYDLNKVKQLPIAQLAKKPKLGDKVKLTQDPCLYRVTEVKGKNVTLDGNHPLAGQDLIFEVDVIQARFATTEEIREANDEDMLFH
jgi:FKBP-type peptidyl-prolyl cis-trans isomerase SlyD